MQDNEQIFPEKFIDNLDAMYTLALQLVPEMSRAEELVHRTVERAYHSLSKYNKSDDLSHWLLEQERALFKELY